MTTKTKLGSRFDDALKYAVTLHRDQERKGSGVPYAAHLLGAAASVLHFGGDEDQAIAALLHDAAEDQGGRATLDRIRSAFGDRVARIVEGCTDTFEDPKPAWRPRKEAYLAQLPGKPAETLLVVACDKLDNARAIVADLRSDGSTVWSRFTGGRDGSLWYYRAVADALLRSSVTSAALALDAAVKELAEVARSVESDELVDLVAHQTCLLSFDDDEG